MAPHSLGAAKHSALWQHIGLIGGTSQLPSKMILQERQPPIQHQLDARFDLPPFSAAVATIHWFSQVLTLFREALETDVPEGGEKAAAEA